MSRKNVGLHGRLTEKILDFEWSKTAQMALKFLDFFGMLRVSLVHQNNFCKTFSFHKGFFMKI